MNRKQPQDPLVNDMVKAVFMALFGIACIFARVYAASLLFFAVSAYWVWHHNRLKKKIDEAYEKREKNYAEIYGYEDGYEDRKGISSGVDENPEDYF